MIPIDTPPPMPPAPEQDISPQGWLRSVEGEQPGEYGAQLYADAYDLACWQQTLQSSARLQMALARSQSAYQGARALLQDLFLSLYKAAPAFSPGICSPLACLHRRLLNDILQTREWQEMRAMGTCGDPVLSAMGALGLCERVIAALDTVTRQQLTALYEVEQSLRQLLDQAREIAETAASVREGEMDGKVASRLAALAEQRRREAGELAAEHALLLPALSERLAKRAQAVRHAARQALRACIQTSIGLAQTQSTLAAVATDEGAGSNAQQSLREKLELAERLQRSDKLREIARLCGQLLPFAHAVQQTSMAQSPQEIDGVTLGREPGRLLPTELALWDDPHTELLFLKRFVLGQLWQYEMRCPHMDARGPLIVALDSSGSMNETLAGQSREIWSKAVALCLLSLARHEARDIAILHFADDVRTYHFVHGQATLAELVECAGHFDSGNTRFEPWMHEALRLVDTASFDRADVICISDGLSDISEETETAWNQRRSQRGMRVFGILLEESAGAQTEGAATFARMSDTTLTLSALTDQQALAGLFAL